MSVATKRLFSGNKRVCPDGVLNARLSNVTAIPSVLVSMPTVFQKRLSVFSAPENAVELKLLVELMTYGWFPKQLDLLEVWLHSSEK